METNLRTIVQEDWMLAVLAGTLFVLSWSKFMYPKLFSQYRSVLINQKYLLSFHKGKMLSHPYALLMSLSSWMNLSLFCYLIISTLAPHLTYQFKISFLYISAYIGAFILVKTMLQLLVGELFNNELIKRYLFGKLSISSYSSWVFALGSILLIYVSNQNNTIIYSSLSIFLLLYSIGIINLLRNHKKYIFSALLYFILYLCTLEIAPLIIIIKYLNIA